MVFTFKKLNFKNSKKFKKIQNKNFFQKFISRKLLVLERFALHHRVENIEKYLTYMFCQRHLTAWARPKLPHKKEKTLFLQVEEKRSKQ